MSEPKSSPEEGRDFFLEEEKMVEGSRREEEECLDFFSLRGDVAFVPDLFCSDLNSTALGEM